ncbi:MAG TPA: ABC transporter ATP-binding protein [Rhizomicrobium sp.]|jgi:ATP-binding cassette subfamily C protein
MRAGAAKPSNVFVTAGALLKDFSATIGWKGPPAAALATIGALLEGLSVSLLVPLVSIIVQSQAVPGWLSRSTGWLFFLLHVETQSSRLLLLLGLFGLLFMLRAVVLAARDVAVAELQYKFVEAQRLYIARLLVGAQWRAVTRLRHARVIQVMSGDMQWLSIGINALLGAAVALTMLLVQCVLILMLAPGATVPVLALIAVGFFIGGPVLKRARTIGGHITEANLKLLDSAAQFLGGLKLAASQNLEKSFLAQIEGISTGLVERQLRYAKQQARGRAAATIFSAVVGIALVLAGTSWLHLPSAVLISLLFIVSRMMAPLTQLQQGIQQFGHTLAVYAAIRALATELPQDRRDYTQAAATGVPDGDIAFQNVSFFHADARGLSDFSITIRSGEFLGITGPSGTGKTTFADLLAGLYPPQRGHIRVGDLALEGEAMLKAWRDGLSYVAQDAFLFHDTIRSNLTWANQAATEAEIWEALALVGADAMVRAAGGGLDTMVGERGVLMSGGERQRLALARALLRRPRLLLLDEATSAIDSDSERAIFTSLKWFPATIVLIAHRRDSLFLCDRLFDMAARQVL